MKDDFSEDFRRKLLADGEARRFYQPAGFRVGEARWIRGPKGSGVNVKALLVEVRIRERAEPPAHRSELITEQVWRREGTQIAADV